ncbi:hypothetical protein PILCRDRAFT_826732 [Piloderma croceum F 1598]|uniref:Uncharacterized protein n=1 Tax=Piloderma croceum (strain F 1598) TaxID=765440 RepID=A0A0C3F815_PILCF|nr:hypothetical protein PILCRDRAFT_826732 [Piloderma croceum F 1598]
MRCGWVVFPGYSSCVPCILREESIEKGRDEMKSLSHPSFLYPNQFVRASPP